MDVLDLGLMDYREALKVQEDVLARRIEGKVRDTLIIVEHYPVLTLGRLSLENSILDRSFFEKEGIDIVETRRGGKITYHAPGQLVLYPIIDLRDKKRDVSFYIDVLERSAAASLRGIGVPALAGGSRRGVWAQGKKIAFIGIGLKSWVTYHGVAVNINNDISPFEKIDPCGESDIRVTSAEICAGRKIDMREAKNVFIAGFARDLEKEYENVFEAA